MSIVYVNSLRVPVIARNKRDYSGGFVSNTNTTTQSVPTGIPWASYDDDFIYQNRPFYKAVVEVTSNPTPIVPDYQTLLAPIYGEWPTVRLFITDGANTAYESMQKPRFNYVTGLLDSIVFDIGEPINGFIIIS